MTKMRLLGVLALVLAVAATARAQTATGQITGTVKDTSGAVVPGVTVTVTSELTGSKRETTTGQTGNYVVPLLPVSVYSVTAEMQGFRPARLTGVRLSVDQVVRADLELQTGSLSETYLKVFLEDQGVSVDEVTIRVTLKTAPMEQWRVAREMRARIKARFDEQGIGTPDAQPVVVAQAHDQPDDPPVDQASQSRTP